MQEHGHIAKKVPQMHDEYKHKMRSQLMFGTTRHKHQNLGFEMVHASVNKVMVNSM